MGRGSFETVVGFEPWPYDKPVVVLSHSLSADDIPSHLRKEVRIFASSPSEIMQIVEKEGWKWAYIDGGKIIQSFLRAGLIDGIIITLLPVLLRQGISLFGENRVQEASEKYQYLHKEIDLHLIGHLQSNKVKKALEIFNWIQSIDKVSTRGLRWPDRR